MIKFFNSFSFVKSNNTIGKPSYRSLSAVKYKHTIIATTCYFEDKKIVIGTENGYIFCHNVQKTIETSHQRRVHDGKVKQICFVLPKKHLFRYQKLNFLLSLLLIVKMI